MTQSSSQPRRRRPHRSERGDHRPLHRLHGIDQLSGLIQLRPRHGRSVGVTGVSSGTGHAPHSPRGYDENSRALGAVDLLAPTRANRHSVRPTVSNVPIGTFDVVSVLQRADPLGRSGLRNETIGTYGHESVPLRADRHVRKKCRSRVSPKPASPPPIARPMSAGQGASCTHRCQSLFHAPFHPNSLPNSAGGELGQL